MPWSEQPEVSVVLPVYRAGARLPERLAQFEQFVLGAPFGIELVLVNDGSDGADHETLFTFAAQRGAVRYVRHEKNEGKGRAVADGVAVASAPIIIFTDVDLPYDLEVIAQLRDVFASDARLSFAVGSRRHPASRAPQPYGWERRLASRLFTRAARLVADDTFTDVQCGLKAFRRDAARLLFSDLFVRRFAFDTELFLRAKKYGLQYVEVPVVFRHEQRSTVRLLPAALRMARDLAHLYVRYRRGRP